MNVQELVAAWRAQTKPNVKCPLTSVPITKKGCLRVQERNFQGRCSKCRRFVNPTPTKHFTTPEQLIAKHETSTLRRLTNPFTFRDEI